MLDPDRHGRQGPIHYDSSGRAMQLNKVIIEPFVPPAWVRSQADYNSALTAYVTAQIDRGVPRADIVEHLATRVGVAQSDAERFYRAVARLRRRKLRRGGWERILGGIISMAIGGGLFSLIYLVPLDFLARTPEWLRYILFIAFIAVVTSGVIGGLVSIATGAWRVVRYLR